MIGLRKKYILYALYVLLAAGLIWGVRWYVTGGGAGEKDEYEIDRSALENLPLSDNTTLYSEYDQSEVVNVYITVYTGVDEKTGQIFNFEELNHLRAEKDGDPALRANVKIGDFQSGEYALGSDSDEVNCTLSMRGQSSRKQDLKSYKIKIYDGAGSFRGQSVLNLNKHTVDDTRLKSKFCFDYISLFPDMVSLRTTFVHLFIKDASNNDFGYTDYGLFTHVEQPNKDFLRAHLLDPNGTLYKPSDFEFIYDDEVLLPETDPAFDKDLFSEYLKIRENADNQKLIQMLRDVNDYTKNFDEVFEKYFDQDNYLTWLAMNLLLDDYDTASRNYLLYSPSYSQTWFFLPWDYDGTLLTPEDRKATGVYYLYGIARYWGTVLHNRFFRDTDHLKLLDDKVEEIYALMSREQTDELLQTYEPVIRAFLSTPPDSLSVKGGLDTALAKAAAIPQLIEENRTRYYESREQPMPFFLGSPKLESGRWHFHWDASFDFQGDSISYELIIARDLTMQDIVYDEDGIYLTDMTLKTKLSAGTYYWTVIATDSSGHQQTPFEHTRVDNVYYHGVKTLTVD